MDQKQLWADLSGGRLSKLYLLFGEEGFLVDFYAGAIEDAARKAAHGEAFYKDVFDGGRPAADIVMAVSAVPFFPGRRLALVRDSKLFAAGRKADSETMADFLPRIPDDTIMVFAEKDVDRRLRLFKRAAELGCAVNNETQTAQALAKWLVRQAKARGSALSAEVAGLIVDTCGASMAALDNEMKKLAAFAWGRPITESDVREVAIPNPEARIFALTKAAGAGDAKEALAQFANLIRLRESPFMVLTMLTRQLRLILMCKLGQEKKLSRQKIAADLKLQGFAVNEALQQGRRFTAERLLALLADCLDTDIKIKTGLISDELGVEMLLVRIAAGAKI